MQWAQVFRYGVSLCQGHVPPNGAVGPFSSLCLPLKSSSHLSSVNSRLLRVPSLVRFCPFTEVFYNYNYYKKN